MSMLLMLIALLGAVMVLAAGMVVVRWGTRGRTVEATKTEPEPVPEPESELPGALAGVGGYWPFPEGTFAGERFSALSPQTLGRVRELLALERGAEAVEVVREETGADPHRAQEIVELVRRGWTL